MGLAQHTSDWDARFRVGDTPWEDLTVPDAVVHLVRDYAAPGCTIFEIGCGLGTTAMWLARHGFEVTACDVSAEAIRMARERTTAAGLRVDYHVANVLTDSVECSRSDVVFTRGVLHTFKEHLGRATFAAVVAKYLADNGLWLDVSGSADTVDAPGARERDGLPRLTLVDVAMATEPHFEVLSIARVMYGQTPGRTDFLAWASALRRRESLSP